MRSTINLNDTNNFYYYSIAVLFSLSSSLISEKIANKFIKYTWVRKLILGSKYVEGYWFLKTYPVKEDPGSPLLNNGILYMSYDDDSNEFSVSTTRIKDGVQKFHTLSDVAHIRTSTPHIAYLNFFRLIGLEDNKINGFSSGFFPKSNTFFKIPTSFEAELSVQNEGITRKQFASRIPVEVVKSFCAKYGTLWEELYLKIIDEAYQKKTEEQVDNILEKLGDDNDRHLQEHKNFLKLHIMGMLNGRVEHATSMTELEKPSETELEEVANDVRTQVQRDERKNESLYTLEQEARERFYLPKDFTCSLLNERYAELSEKAPAEQIDQINADYEVLRGVCV